MNIKETWSKFISDSRRILVVSRKPTMDEYKKMALIIALGMVIIGIMGFIVQLFFVLTGLGI
ncbi:MAG: protein translocase SEC61 complex subunit gamma [Candidatus Diapherotrites archaeon]|nr:protein translocase SEC61 complex subunit gamma [Candidatus Diapherotrites archaeon]MBT4597340.1 protein translocase SEC61 complex subunit gamma [Candidatus Diapherotrites archaeon]